MGLRSQYIYCDTDTNYTERDAPQVQYGSICPENPETLAIVPPLNYRVVHILCNVAYH